MNANRGTGRADDARVENQLRALAQALRGETAAPGWTAGNDGDPGITLLELLAFAAEDLLSRGIDRLGAGEHDAIARRLESVAHALKASAPESAGCSTAGSDPPASPPTNPDAGS